MDHALHVNMKWMSVPAALVVALSSAGAAASEGAIGDDMRAYYRGERTSAFVIGGIGLAGAAGGAALLTRDSDFARGLGVPLVALGGLEAIGAVVYAFEVDAEVDRYSSLLVRDPAGYRRVELDHIEGTTQRFAGYRLAELTLTLAGIGAATYGFVADRDAWKGAGLGVAAMAAPLLVIDTINQSRAVSYRERVRAMKPAITVTPGAVGAPWSLSIAGRF